MSCRIQEEPFSVRYLFSSYMSKKDTHKTFDPRTFRHFSSIMEIYISMLSMFYVIKQGSKHIKNIIFTLSFSNPKGIGISQ